MKRTALLLLVFLLLSASGCALKTVRPEVFGDADSAARVLVATDASDFKGAVVKDVIERLTQKGAYVCLIPINDLSRKNPEDYSAVILVNTVIAWQAKPDAAAFIKRAKDRDRIILVSTAGDPDFTADYEGVDAVTAASEISGAGGLADEIVKKAERLLWP